MTAANGLGICWVLDDKILDGFGDDIISVGVGINGIVFTRSTLISLYC